MSLAASKRSVMTLFSQPLDIHSHRVRMVLAEKGISVDICDVVEDEIPEDLLDLNPYNAIPTLVDRELVLYEPRIVMEYLDERFPHPPLMPVDPVSRARFRLALHRIESDWYSLLPLIDGRSDRKASSSKKQLKESLIAANDAFSVTPYFLSEEFSLVDCSIAPVLWRLPYYGVDIPKEAAAVSEYASRIFARKTFQASLTEDELELRG